MTSDYQKYLSLTLKWLGRRPRSRHEITQYLEKKNLATNLINQIISYLEQHTLIDDAEFAKWVIESRSRSSPRGSRLLKQELKAKGIDESTIYDHLMAINENEPQLAADALKKKLPLWKNLSYREYRIKATRFLMSKGFSWTAIETAVKKGYNTEDVN